MRLPGRTTAIRSARWLRSRSRQRALLLGYHRIADPAGDVYGLSVSADRFAEQLDIVARLANPVRLQELVGSLARGAVPTNAVAVTFDDGYADNLELALPRLEQAGIPATVFVVSGYLGREFWWDELARLVSTAGEADPSGAAGRRTIALRAAGLRSLPDANRRDSLAAMAGAVEALSPVHRAMTADELARLSRSGLIDVGAHSVTHPVLPRLSEAEQRREIVDCRRALEAIAGRAVHTFSYPHGAVSPATASIVRDAGYMAACCSTPDVATLRSDPLALPRFWVGDWDGDRFERFLRRWLLV